MKIFILATDGVGLRNFLFTDFLEQGKSKGHEVYYWNLTHYPIAEKYSCKEIELPRSKNHPLSDLYHNAKKQIELGLSYKNSKNEAYLSYVFRGKISGFKSLIKQFLIKFFKIRYNSAKGVLKINKKVAQLERSTQAYREARLQLQEQQPDFVFCTNQRIIKAIAPLLAAQDLGIPTATFIFSWDNLPKATMVVMADYYFVWSAHMKKELISYYPHINENQIKIVGTPQFQPHYSHSIKSRKDFFSAYELDCGKKYICFSGDDITTSPNDPYYLEDLAKSVIELNKKGCALGIIFRRCPVDFSDRFDNVLQTYKNVIRVIDPLWRKHGTTWQTIMPTPEDMGLLANISKHAILVVNVGSSMVFDFAIHGNPCAYLNYDTFEKDDESWTIKKIYKYIHFQSMPNNDQVFWVNHKNDFKRVILDVLETNNMISANEWFAKINAYPTNASDQIFTQIEKIIDQ